MHAVCHLENIKIVIYLDVLENLVIPQLGKLQPHTFLELDGAPLQVYAIVYSSLNDHLTERWFEEMAQFLALQDHFI